MPCSGPSEAEIRAMEREENSKKINKAWTMNEFMENVACALTAHIRHNQPIPAWATKWMDDHEARDRARKQAEKNRKEEREEREYQQWVKLNRKFGKKGVK